MTMNQVNNNKQTGMVNEQSSPAVSLPRDSSSLLFAVDFAKKGYSVFPLQPRSKKPPEGFRWDPFTRSPASPESIEKWFTANPEANYAIICGHISHLTVIDIDAHNAPQAALLALVENISALNPQNPPYAVRTGSGGFHLYYGHTPGLTTTTMIPVENIANNLVLNDELRKALKDVTIDIKCDRSYIVGPGSIHPNGEPYLAKYKNGSYSDTLLVPHSSTLPRMPEILSNLGKEKRGGEKTQEDWQAITEGTTEGNRNDNSVSMIGLLLHHLPPQYFESVAFPLIRNWNKTMVNPPLPDRELETKLKHYARKECGKREV